MIERDLLIQIQRLTLEHIMLVVTSVAIAGVIAIPFGIYCSRGGRGSKLVLRLADIVQTIPSLALFGFLIPIPFIGGIGARTAIVALILYSLLPMIRTTATSIRGIDPLLIEAGVTLGMTPRQLLWRVEFPLALPGILSGVRIATVLAIGVATIAAAIGGGGLGTFIFRGVAMVDSRLILAGAIPAALLALAADLVIGFAERRLKFVNS